MDAEHCLCGDVRSVSGTGDQHSARRGPCWRPARTARGSCRSSRSATTTGAGIARCARIAHYKRDRNDTSTSRCRHSSGDRTSDRSDDHRRLDTTRPRSNRPLEPTTLPCKQPPKHCADSCLGFLALQTGDLRPSVQPVRNGDGVQPPRGHLPAPAAAAATTAPSRWCSGAVQPSAASRTSP